MRRPSVPFGSFRLRRLAFAAAPIATALPLLVSGSQLPNDAEHEAIAYSSSAPTDSIARLQEKIDDGEVKLVYDEHRGYLPSLLDRLEIPVSSQGLVFSRTSLQVDRISPWTPRAIYFNDDVYVGWVQGGPVVEIASADPNLGAVFYTLSQNESVPPRFERQTTTCLMCHDSSSITGGVPGFILRSVFPDRYGYVIASVRDGATTDRTPLEKRWGGWYVTGSPGEERHAGNSMSPLLLHEIGNVSHYLSSTDLSSGQNESSLEGRFDTKPYLSPHSDAVALLILAHQSYLHNLITRASYEARKALYDEKLVIEQVGEPKGAHLTTTLNRVQRATEPLVRGLLFVKEAPLPSPIEGTSGFASEFSRRGPRDREGRSLRDLDLKRRLFRYPLSYLIYSESFDALPAVVKETVYRRLGEVLRGEDESSEFAHLDASDRAAILAILRDTKPDFSAD
jgi:hypothetical protein